jgi:hypothetical protein
MSWGAGLRTPTADMLLIGTPSIIPAGAAAVAAPRFGRNPMLRGRMPGRRDVPRVNTSPLKVFAKCR